MQTAALHDNVFNSSKCQIRQPQITFCGAVFTAKGMWADPLRIQTLQDLQPPESTTKLQSFLVFINCLQLFIPVLDNKMMFLQKQTAKWE